MHGFVFVFKALLDIVYKLSFDLSYIHNMMFVSY